MVARESEGRRRAWLVVLAVLVASYGVWHWLKPQPIAPSNITLPVEDARERTQKPRWGVTPPAQIVPRPDQRCESGAEVRCYQGDVWAFDSCGKREEKLEECEARACEDTICAPEPEKPCLEPNEGRCDGGAVHFCLAGVAQTVDCKSRGMECAVGSEGAECRPPRSAEELCPKAPFCEEDVLVGCLHGVKTRTTCGAFGAKCAALSAGAAPRCIATLPGLSLNGCGPCGCSGEPLGEARCDGADDDRDGVIDEGADCGPVGIVAFVVGDDTGNTSHAEDDVQQEIARVNALFSSRSNLRSPSFFLEQTVWLNDSRLTEIDEDELNALTSATQIQNAREGFYVPVLFTDRLVSEGGVPKAGLSTLPNGTCGGVQVGLGPELGVVAVAKGRSTTTLAHELGHFFGLCHTHEQVSDLARTFANEAGQSNACEPSCAGDGDGICDTLPDPGVEECKLEASCVAQCAHGEFAPVDNVMSYYTPCRTQFTPEQIQLVDRTIALRRAWQKCLRGSCACEPGASQCPFGMGCRPTTSGDGARESVCRLVGSLPTRADCEDSRQCAGEALCVTEQRSRRSQCARTCRASSVGCTCDEIEPGLAVCSEDLRSRS